MLRDRKSDRGGIGVLGGTFNPIHYGHLRIAEEAREKLGLDKVLFVPAGNPPLKNRDLADSHHRYEMTGLAIGTSPFFELSDIECGRRAKSYTVETLAELSQLFPEKDLYFILGIDSFLDIPSWYQPERLADLAHFVVVSRPGQRFTDLSSRIPVDVKTLIDLDSCNLEVHRSVLGRERELFLLNVTPMGISSTAIRALIGEGMSIKYLLPETVESYIIANKLYMRNE